VRLYCSTLGEDCENSQGGKAIFTLKQIHPIGKVTLLNVLTMVLYDFKIKTKIV
jgi:hypothetical protein